MKKRQSLLVLLSVLTLFMAWGQSARAFSDMSGDPNADKINALQERGILKGDSNGKYNPGGNLTYAAGVSIIVKGFGLNIDNLRFVKEPKATHYFPNLKDDAWYTDTFIIAQHNGLEIPKDVKADQIMTREQFAYHLFQGMMRTGEYFFTEQYMDFADEAAVNPLYMNSIQKLLISAIISLDEKRMFYPKATITRSAAAGWLHDAISFVGEKQAGTPSKPSPLSNMKLETKAVNANVNEVTVKADAPHPGYGIRISSIVFEGDRAIIHTETVMPEPDKMYPQVITEVKTTTYISTAYKPVLAEAPQSRNAASSSFGSRA
ncbi:S-layer protein [Paenibacillus darwinianus]|uniref:S-layer protein n=1 Tax=Paenibacillus darwinianus TaxID=1380763 RepID=A0A9W5S1Z1_9BACL|nr:S-layer homology domain-containing protein [Paenibacillus darwinianus]EXX85573.1 S-layer protein [Paenibacillus darwinianus]EXX88311.1 S-layer protein [Paenibacillus darwinianus]EXX89844.1 S-layer protein [Paenibacillus darwinianus]